MSVFKNRYENNQEPLDRTSKFPKPLHRKIPPFHPKPQQLATSLSLSRSLSLSLCPPTTPRSRYSPVPRNYPTTEQRKRPLKTSPSIRPTHDRILNIQNNQQISRSIPTKTSFPLSSCTHPIDDSEPGGKKIIVRGAISSPLYSTPTDHAFAARIHHTKPKASRIHARLLSIRLSGTRAPVSCQPTPTS